MGRFGSFFTLLFLGVLGTLGCKNQVLDGVVRDYHKNGQLASEISYKNGKLCGILRTWYENGQLHDSANFINDSIVGYNVSFFKNGIKNYENYYNKDHKRHGVCRSWFSNGMLSSEEILNNGKLDGQWKIYYPHGVLRAVYSYKNGLKDGKLIEFNESGDTTKVEIYLEGRLLDKKI